MVLADRKAHREYMRKWLQNPVNAEKNREKSRRWRAANRERHRAAQAEYRRAHPEVESRWRRQNRLKLDDQHMLRSLRASPSDMKQARSGLCDLYHQPETVARVSRLSIDHDHSTGSRRGVLCLSCNISLGYYERGSKNTKFHRLGVVGTVETYLAQRWY